MSSHVDAAFSRPEARGERGELQVGGWITDRPSGTPRSPGGAGALTPGRAPRRGPQPSAVAG